MNDEVNRAAVVGGCRYRNGHGERNARGSQELVLGLLALQAKIIDDKIFVGLVVMTIVSILISGPLMRYFLKKDDAHQEEKNIIPIETEAEIAAI